MLGSNPFGIPPPSRSIMLSLAELHRDPVLGFPKYCMVPAESVSRVGHAVIPGETWLLRSSLLLLHRETSGSNELC